MSDTHFTTVAHGAIPVFAEHNSADGPAPNLTVVRRAMYLYFVGYPNDYKGWCWVVISDNMLFFSSPSIPRYKQCRIECLISFL
jgi:hypothetical protein